MNPAMNTHTIELLESRIAPAAAFVNPSLGAYTDEDGDIVMVRFSKPILSTTNISSILVTSPAGNGEHLDTIDVKNRVAASGIDILVTTRVAGNGDGLANIGVIDATNVDLGTVIVHGDLGQILAGDATTSTPGLKSLYIHTFGVIDTLSGTAPEASAVIGSTGSLVVTTDMSGANFQVESNAAVDGTLGSVFIGGNLTGGTGTFGGILFAKGDIGRIVIRGSIIGQKASTGYIISDSGAIGSVRIGGSLFGGSEADSGVIFAASIGSVSIRHNVLGGDGDRSGEIFGGSRIGSVSVGGGLFGGAGANSGRITSNGVIRSVSIGSSVVGGGAAQTGYIDAGLGLGSIVIGGSLVGGSSDFSGGIVSGGNIGPIAIGGDLIGGGSDNTIGETGEIRSLGSIASIRIGGSAIAAFGSFNGAILAAGSLGPVAIVGDISSFGDAFFLIRAIGTPGGNAITSLSVGGSVSSALVLAGFGTNNAGINGDASIGPVNVGGNWVASSIAAGVENPNLPNLGDSDDTIIAGSTIVSRIASINIGGYIRGTDGGTDHYGFAAQHIGRVTVAGSIIPLSPAIHTDDRSIGLTSDVSIREA